MGVIPLQTTQHSFFFDFLRPAHNNSVTKTRTFEARAKLAAFKTESENYFWSFEEYTNFFSLGLSSLLRFTSTIQVLLITYN
jgi:hypothetical protein